MRASAKAEMWHKPERPLPSRVTNTPYVCTRRTVPIVTRPTCKGGRDPRDPPFNNPLSLGAEASTPSLLSVISTCRAAVSTKSATPRTSAPFGNALIGSSTNASERLHILTRASTSRATATNTPPFVTFLTYPLKEPPGCKDARMSPF